MVSKGPFASLACRDRLACPMFGEAVIVMNPASKHGELFGRTRFRLQSDELLGR